MKSGALVFLVAFVALAASWGGFVLAPQVQLSRCVQTNTLGSSDLYPLGRPGLAKQGLEVYRANGCVYCHSQQIVQEGTLCEIMLMEAGTNAAATAAAMAKLNPTLAKLDARELFSGLPKRVLEMANVKAADPVIKALGDTGAKAQARVVPQGADIARLGQTAHGGAGLPGGLSGATGLAPRGSGPGQRRLAVAGPGLAIAPSLCATERGSRFVHAAVSLFVRDAEDRQGSHA